MGPIPQEYTVPSLLGELVMENLQRFPNLNHLYYFHVVAQNGSIKRAAEVLNVTEPTISAQIRQLETFFDRRLFHRESGGMRLTDDGRQVFNQTAPMFRAASRLLHTFAPGKSDERITIEVGVTSPVTNTFAGHYFVPLFREEGVLVRVRHGDYTYLLRDLIAREVDVVLSDNVPTESARHDVQHKVVHRPELIAVAPPEIAEQIVRFPDDLDGFPFLHYTARSKYRFELDQLFLTHGIIPHVVGESDDVGVMLAAACAALCVAVVPREIASEACSRGDVVPLGICEGVDASVFALFKGTDPDPLVARLIRTLKASTGFLDS